MVPTSVMKRLRVGGEGTVDSINMAHALVLLARGGSSTFSLEEVDQGVTQQRVFECKTCSRRFPSFQALGGHRASHKKPRLASGDLQEGPAQRQAGRPRVHECSVCGVEFTIGQALGGHMRRHRAASSTAVPFHHHPPAGEKEAAAGEKGNALCLDLDLNLSPSENDVDLGTSSLGLGLPMVAH